ncbi:MAG: urocanate hydratase [Pseudomonadota bacterium]|nr:urocanate hydratase [Rubrivivax sp.]
MTADRRFDVTRGPALRCRGWRQEGLLRLLENVLAVGERPQDLVVYAALGKAARDWPSHDRIVSTLRTMEEGQTLVVQSGKPIGLMRTHAQAPLVLMANCNLVGQWARAENFYALEKAGLICWGGLTAGDWQYIGSQGVIQGTYEIFARIAERHFGGSLAGRWILTAGLGGMGGAQPLAACMAGASILCVEVDGERIDKRIAAGYLQQRAPDLEAALAMIRAAQEARQALSVGLQANAADVYPELVERGLVPDIVTDQTSAHDLLYGYIPREFSLAQVRELRAGDPQRLMAASTASIVRHVGAMLAFQRAGAVVFDNGNLIRTQAKAGGVADAFDIPIFTEAFLRPLFARAIGPFRWIALSGDPMDIERIDRHLLEHFGHNASIVNWIGLARRHIRFEGLPARIAWMGHGERTALALAVNRMVADGSLRAPVAFTRDHLDAGAMAHPNIMTERMRDGSDAVADWPLLNAMLNCSSQADLVAIHSGGGGYSGYMTSAGVTLVADGTPRAEQRLQLTLDNDTSLGVMRYADAGYAEALDEVERRGLDHFTL